MRAQLLIKSIGVIFRKIVNWGERGGRQSGEIDWAISACRSVFISIRGPAHRPVISAQLEPSSLSSLQHGIALLSVGRCHRVINPLYGSSTDFLWPSLLCCLFFFFFFSLFVCLLVPSVLTNSCGLKLLLCNSYPSLGKTHICVFHL